MRSPGSSAGTPGRVAGDRLAGDAADGVVDRDQLGLAEERLARRDRDLEAERGGGRDERARGARLAQPLDDLVHVARQPPQRRGRLAEPDHEHDRRLHRQLEVDVVGAPQGVGDLVAGAAGAAHVEHHPQRVVAGHAHLADELRVDQLDPLDRLQLLARHLDRPQRLPQQLLAVQRELAARRVERRDQQRRGAGRAQQPQRAGDRADVDAAAAGDVQHRALRQRAGDLVGAGEHRVGALRERGRRQLVVEAEVRAPRLVDHQRHPGGVRDLRHRGDVGRHAVVGRRHDERGARVGGVAQPPLERGGRDAVGDPELGVVLGGDEARDPAAQNEPVDDRRVRVALGDDPRAERRQRQAQRVVALRRPVGEEERPLGAERLRGQALRALVRRRGRPEVDPVDVLRHVGGQRVDADRLAQAGSAPGPPLWPGTW